MYGAPQLSPGDLDRLAFEWAYPDLAHEVADGRWVVTGGGGYSIVDVVPRSWAHLLAIAPEISERDPYANELILPTTPLALNAEQAAALNTILHRELHALAPSMVSDFLEADVAEPRRLMREHRERTGEGLSLTAYVVSCLARAVAEHPTLNSLRRRGKLVTLDDVHKAYDDRELLRGVSLVVEDDSELTGGAKKSSAAAHRARCPT